MRLFQRGCLLLLLSATLACQHRSLSQDLLPGKYIIRANETVRIQGRSVQVTNKGCGRKWISNNNQPAFESAYCDIVIKSDDSTINTSGDNDPYYIDDLEIMVDRMNPWGAMEDSVPAGAIRIAVQQSPAFALLQKFGWQPTAHLQSTQVEIPVAQTGQPWTNYVEACRKSGYSLEKLAGEQVKLLTVLLKEKGKRSGKYLEATILCHDNVALTGWLSTPAIESGVLPLNADRQLLANW